MQKYYDYHTHSHISFDANISIQQTCALALKRGACGLTFTEHAVFENDPALDELPDIGAYEGELAVSRAAFPALELGMGLELDLNPARLADTEKLLKAAEWDFVLGSMHELEGYNLSEYDCKFCIGKSDKQAYHTYFSGLYERVKACPSFDSLGHLDLLLRHHRFNDRPFDYADHAEILDALLKLLIQRGQGLEVNTAGPYYGAAEMHPGLTVLRRYRQLGGDIITCGSDCHSGPMVFRCIMEGYKMIKEAGFKYVSLFYNRELHQLKLEI